MEAIDLSIYREDGNHEWFYEELRRIGEKRMNTMRDWLFRKAQTMPCGSTFNLIENCTDKQNLRLMVRVCCEIIITNRLESDSKHYFEFADSNYNIFRKVAI